MNPDRYNGWKRKFMSQDIEGLRSYKSNTKLCLHRI